MKAIKILKDFADAEINLHRTSSAKHYLDALEELGQLQAEIEKLKEFARKVTMSECWGSACFGSNNLDGFDIQELAKKLGLIKKHIATGKDIDENSTFTIGDMIYVFGDILKGGE